MDFEIQTSSVDSTVERLKKRREAARQTWRIMIVAISVAAYLSAGTLMFGVIWLNQLSEYLYGGASLGAIVGIGVVAYTIWIEINAAADGDKHAVWNAQTTQSKPFTFAAYVRTMSAFAFLTIISLGLFGALVASSLALVENLNDELPRSTILIAITVTTAGTAAAFTKSFSGKNS